MSSFEMVQIGSTLTSGTSDVFGKRTAISYDGTVIAIAGDISTDSDGYVKVYENINGVWTQRGSTLETPVHTTDEFGYSLALNGDGTILLVGAPGYNSDSGRVRIFEWDGSSWSYINLDSSTTGNKFGFSVAINYIGDTIFIGVPGYDSNKGKVSKYSYSNSSTTLITSYAFASHTPPANANIGYSISINELGTKIIIGAPYWDDGSIRGGQVFWGNATNTGITSKQTRYTSSLNQGFGYSVSMSGNGSYVAVGIKDRNTADGQVKVFSFNNSLLFTYDSVANTGESGELGTQVSLNSAGDILVVGAPLYDSTDNQGLVEVLVDVNGNGTGFSLKSSITGAVSSNDRYGINLEIDNENTIIIGASGINSAKIYKLTEILTTTTTITDPNGNDYILSGVNLKVIGDLSTEQTLQTWINDSTLLTVDGNNNSDFNDKIHGSSTVKLITTGISFTIYGTIIPLTSLQSYNISYQNIDYVATVTFYGGSGGVELSNLAAPCLTDTCFVLTPDGYKNVSGFKKGDIVTTSDNNNVPIIKIFNSISTDLPYLLPANSLGKNKPMIDTHLSAKHKYLHKRKWKFPKDNFKVNWDSKTVTYYHIKLPNYEKDHLVVNGIITESWDGYLPLQTKNL